MTTPRNTILAGDVRRVLPMLADGSIDCVVTSPPYWGLRDYGSIGQLGLEPTLEEYVARTVEVFREVRRVLAPHGTLWLNLGDSYNAAPTAKRRPTALIAHGYWRAGGAMGDRRVSAPPLKRKDLVGLPWRVAFGLQADGWYLRSDVIWAKPNPMPESARDRPTKGHEYVFLLAKRSRYYFDQEAVREPAEWARWGKQTTPKYQGTRTAAGWMRPRTKAELEAIRRPQSRRAWELFEKHGLTDAHLDAIRAVGITDTGKAQHTQEGLGKNVADVVVLAEEAKAALGGYYREFLVPALGRNVRSVWEIATQPFPGAHFATFPEALVRRCLLAGCPEQVCATCGLPRTRQTRVSYVKSPIHGEGSVHGSRGVAAQPTHLTGGRANKVGVSGQPRFSKRVMTLGWRDCGHGAYRPGLVLDPFFGAGTTGVVAESLGRDWLGVELSPSYVALARRRLEAARAGRTRGGPARRPQGGRPTRSERAGTRAASSDRSTRR